LNKTKIFCIFSLFFAATPRLRTESYGVIAALMEKSTQHESACVLFSVHACIVLWYGTLSCIALHYVVEHDAGN